MNVMKNEEERKNQLLKNLIDVGGVLAIAAAEISQRIGKGEKIRDDGFFSEKINGRSDADEAVESILLKGQREPEEKKDNLYGAFSSKFSFSSGNQR